MKIEHPQAPSRPKARTISAHLPADIAAALDEWVASQPEPRPDRSEAVRLALHDWLTGQGLLNHRDGPEGANGR